MISVITPFYFIETSEKKLQKKHDAILMEILHLFFEHLVPDQEFPQAVSIPHMERVLNLSLAPYLLDIQKVLEASGWQAYVDRFNHRLVIEVHPNYNSDDEY